MSEPVLYGSEVEILIFFLPPVRVNLWGGFRGFILSVFQLNSPGKVKLPISFCFSFVYRYTTRRYTTIKFSKQFAQLIRLYLKGKCFVVFDISLAAYEVKNYFLKLNGTLWNKCLNERTGVEAEGTVGEREIQCESTPRTILETRLCSQSITILTFLDQQNSSSVCRTLSIFD